MVRRASSQEQRAAVAAIVPRRARPPGAGRSVPIVGALLPHRDRHADGWDEIRGRHHPAKAPPRRHQNPER